MQVLIECLLTFCLQRQCFNDRSPTSALPITSALSSNMPSRAGKPPISSDSDDDSESDSTARVEAEEETTVGGEEEEAQDSDAEEEEESESSSDE